MKTQTVKPDFFVLDLDEDTKLRKHRIGQRIWSKCNILQKTARHVCSESSLKIQMVLFSWYREGRAPFTFWGHKTCFKGVSESPLCALLPHILLAKIFNMPWHCVSCVVCPEPCHAQLLLSLLLPRPLNLHPTLFLFLRLCFIFSGISFFPWAHSDYLYTFFFNSYRDFWRGQQCYTLVQESMFVPGQISLCVLEKLLYLIFALDWTMSNLWLLH